MAVQLPGGNWTATHSLESGLGLKGSPVEITGNRGDASQGLLVSVTQLANRSSKQIAAVRFGWYIYRANEPRKILASGQSAVVGLERFGPGSVARLSFPAVRFAEAIEPYVQGGVLTGDFNMEIAVIEARFSDGSVWQQAVGSLGLPATRPN